MARLVALAHRASPSSQVEMLRPFVVSGCALALIFARAALPF
jgi:hypothetical protein